MIDHFKKNHDTFSEIFLEKMINGGSLSEDIRFLKSTARKYINRATVVKKAEVALNLNKEWSRISETSHESQEITGVLQQAEQNLYDLEHDDLFIIAAFENYAKAILLSKRYVVHTIRKPSALNNAQKKRPIDINTIRAEKNLPDLWFEHHTIGVNYLLKPKYMEHLGLSDKAEYAIKKCRIIRNNIHFGGAKVVDYGPGLYEGLQDLRASICS